MKKYSLLLLMVIGAVLTAEAQRDGVTYNRAHQSNYRTWSIGLNGGVSLAFGDLISFSGQQHDLVPEGFGGFEIGARGHLTKFFNTSMGLRGSIGYASLSGSRDVLYFDGNMFDASGELLLNISNLVVRGKIKERKNTILIGVGVGIASSKSYLFDVNRPGDTLAETGLVDFAGRGDAGRATQFYMPVSLEYKRKLSNALDLDVGYRHSLHFKDFIDGHIFGVTTDATGYGYLGVTYNFGPSEKSSIIYANPLDDMFNDVAEVKSNFDQLTTDDDADGVNNFFDKESNTPEGVVVDGSGTAVDADMDGIPDYMDEDPFTGKGARVDAQGRAIDSDSDGVPDYLDKEPNTKEGTIVNFQGKAVRGGGGGGIGSGGAAYLPSVYFAFNSANVSAANQERLATIAKVMKNNPDVTMSVQGHTDARGSEEYNKNLGRRRAEAAVNQLVQVYGIDESRFTIETVGETDPLAQTRYDVNRRVDFVLQ